MVSNDDFDGKATNLNCFYLHINFEQKYSKPAILRVSVVCGDAYINKNTVFAWFDLARQYLGITLWPVWGIFVQN